MVSRKVSLSVLPDSSFCHFPPSACMHKKTFPCPQSSKYGTYRPSSCCGVSKPLENPSPRNQMKGSKSLTKPEPLKNSDFSASVGRDQFLYDIAARGNTYRYHF